MVGRMGARHRQAGAREPGLVGVHRKAVSQAWGRSSLKEDFLELVTLAPESGRAGRIARKDKEGAPHGGREWTVEGMVKPLVQMEKVWRAADGRGHSGAGTRGGGTSARDSDRA